MKNFRSSKNLRALDPSTKEQSGLRMKVKVLQQQVQLLQKSNLNIFIPLSEHEAKNTPNYEAIINKLKTQILNLQQQVQRQKGTIKKMENQKEMMKITHQNEIKNLEDKIQTLNEEKQALNEQIDTLDELLDKEKFAKAELQKNNIELKVQNRFLVDDLQTSKKRLQSAEKKYQQLHSQVLSVKFYSRIYNSKKIKVTAIQTEELTNLKAYIDQLEAKIRQLLQAHKQEKIDLGIKKKDIGQQIVRLKKNIDLQLGLPINQETTKGFMQAYQDTNGCFNELIKACRRT